MLIFIELQIKFSAMAAMLSRKSGILYTDFGCDYSCIVIRRGTIIFQTKNDYPTSKGKLGIARSHSFEKRTPLVYTYIF